MRHVIWIVRHNMLDERINRVFLTQAKENRCAQHKRWKQHGQIIISLYPQQRRNREKDMKGILLTTSRVFSKKIAVCFGLLHVTSVFSKNVKVIGGSPKNDRTQAALFGGWHHSFVVRQPNASHASSFLLPSFSCNNHICEVVRSRIKENEVLLLS